MSSLDLGNLLVHLRMDSSQFLRTISSTEKSLRLIGERMTAVGRNMTMYVTAPILAVGAMATKSFASFDDAMTKSLAIMKGITPNLREEMEKTAITISKQTTTSATGLAKSYFYLASAGLDAERSMSALSAVNDMAIAGSFSLSRAVEMAAGATAALGLDAKNASVYLKNLTRVSDVLVGANFLAQATTGEFAEALGTEAAAAMKVWGIELEEGVAVLAAYAKQMIKGSEAGSAFGRMLRLTMQGYRTNTVEWKKMGLTIYDLEGNLRPLADIIEDLSNKLGNLSPEAKNVSLDLLGFQARSQQVILPLIGMADAIREYEKELKNMSGYSKKTAEKNMMSFASQVRIAWHNVTAIADSIGRILAPYIMKLGDYVKELSDMWESLNDSTKESVVLYGALAASIGPVLVASGLLLKSFAFMISTMKVLAVAFTAFGTAVASPLIAIVALVAIAYVLRAAWLQNVEAIRKRMEEWLNSFKEGFDWLMSGPVGETVRYFVKAWVESFDFVKENFGNFISDMAGTLAGAMSWLIKMKEGVVKAWEAPTFYQMIAEFKSGWEEAGDAFAKSFVGSKEKTDKALADFNDSVIAGYKTTEITLSAFGKATVEQLEDLMKAVKIQFGKDADDIVTLIQSKIQSLQNVPISEHEMLRQQLEVLPGVSEQKQQGKEKGVSFEQQANDLKAGAASLAEAYQQIREQMGKMTEGVYKSSLTALNKQRDSYKALGVEAQVLTAWYKEQAEVLEIEYLRASDSWVKGFKAAGLQIKREIGGLAEQAYQFGMTLERSIETGLENTLRNFENWKESVMNMLEEIYWEVVRVIFIKRVAGYISQGIMSGVGAFAGGGGTATTDATSAGATGYHQYASGGIAWEPQVAHVAETEPELITPFSQLKNVFGSGDIKVSIHNEGTQQEITRAESYMLSDQRILDVWTKDAEGGGVVARTVRNVARRQ